MSQRTVLPQDRDQYDQSLLPQIEGNRRRLEEYEQELREYEEEQEQKKQQLRFVVFCQSGNDYNDRLTCENVQA